VYGGLPDLENVSISPDGTKLAFVVTRGADRLVAIRSLTEHKTLKLLRVSDVKLRSMTWADDNRLMIKTSQTGMPWGLIGNDIEWNLLHVYDVRKDNPVTVPDQNRDTDRADLMNVFFGDVMVRTIDGDTVLFVPGVCTTQEVRLCLVRYDLDTNRQHVLQKGDEVLRGWLVGDDGKILAEDDYNDATGEWRMRVTHDGKLADVASGKDAIECPFVLGFGPSGDTLLAQFFQNGQYVWKLFSLKEWRFGEEMENTQALSSPIEDSSSHRMIGGIEEGDVDRFVFFEPEKQRIWDSILHAYHGEQVRYVSSSRNFRKIIVLVQGPRMGYQYQLVDLDAHQTQSVGDVYKGISRSMEVRTISYHAADGLEIPGYLTLPSDRNPEKLPLIVFPHGGPAVRDTLDFDWWAQALADEGYAVLQPNYRGSKINRKFIELGYGEFGRKMQTDLSDGVRYLVQQGIADPARVCIVGASYGGYAALAGVSLDPKVYRCAVSVAGISDLRSFLKWVDEKNWDDLNREQRYWDRFLGVKDRKDPKLDEISPIKHVSAIEVPVLLIHGKDDTVVPFYQSDDMNDAMRSANKDVEFVKLKGEDHWLSRGPTRLQMLQATVAFLKAHNPPDPPASDAPASASR